MVGKLTGDGYVGDEKIYASIHGEPFEVRDLEVGHPPVKKVSKQPPQKRMPIPQPYPQQQPAHQSQRELNHFNRNPIMRTNGLVTVKRTTAYVAFIIFVLIVLAGIIGIVWFNSNFGKLANKDFATNVNVAPEGDQINITNQYTISPNINNEHTINTNINISVPSELIVDAVEDGIGDAFDFDKMVDEISDKVIEDLEPVIKDFIKNVTNTT